MKKSYIVTAEQSFLIKEGHTKAFYEIVNPQPKPSDVSKIGGTDRYSIFKADDVEQIDKPYEIGQAIYLREPFKKLFFGDKPEIIYAAGIGKVDADIMQNYKWTSAATMPKSAARTFIKIVSVQCKRMKEINADDLDNLGYRGTLGYSPIWYQEYEEQAIAKYGQPVWDNNPFIWIVNFELIQVVDSEILSK